jgi:hypothetical protein
MGSTNRQIEERWIDLWNDLFALVGDRWNMKCQLPDHSIVDIETCKGWLQDAVYQGMTPRVTAGWVQGKQAAIVTLSESPS